MYVEERCYRVRPGALPAYLQMYESRGRLAQLRHVKTNLGYYVSEIGRSTIAVIPIAAKRRNHFKCCNAGEFRR